MMDTSEQYIEMCQRAEEIQELKAIQGIQYSWPLSLVGINEEGNWYAVGKGWLPRQDQLQEMVKHSPYDCFFDGVPNDNGGEKQKIEHYFLQFESSWEQLWLAFVMKEKFGKVWNGEDWTKP